MPPEALKEAKLLVEKRLAELREESVRLERALRELGGRGGRRPGRPTGRKPQRKRRRRGGTRADEALKLVGKNPGIAANEVARQMKIKPNYLYRVLGDLEKEGKVRKNGRAYFPAQKPSGTTTT